MCFFFIIIPATNVAATCALEGPKVDGIVRKGSPGRGHQKGVTRKGSPGRGHQEVVTRKGSPGTATICKCFAVPDRVRKSDV